jgi:hypothetical protein
MPEAATDLIRAERRCGFCREPSVSRAKATEIVTHGLPLGVETHWRCASCGQVFSTLSPFLYVLFLGGALAFALAAVFGPVSGGTEARLFLRLILVGFGIALGVVGATRLQADRKSPRI